MIDDPIWFWVHAKWLLGSFSLNVDLVGLKFIVWSFNSGIRDATKGMSKSRQAIIDHLPANSWRECLDIFERN